MFKEATKKFMKRFAKQKFSVNYFDMDETKARWYIDTISAFMMQHKIYADIHIIDSLVGHPAMNIATENLHAFGMEEADHCCDIGIIFEVEAIERNRRAFTNRFFPELTREQFMEILLVHELSHVNRRHIYSDGQHRKSDIQYQLEHASQEDKRKLLKEFTSIAMRMEQEAWYDGRSLISKDISYAYERFNQLNYKAYTTAFMKELNN